MKMTRPLFVLSVGLCATALCGCDKLKQKLDEAAKQTKSAQATSNPAPDSAAVPAQPTPAQPATTAGQAEVRHLAATDYPAFIAQADRLVVVDFYADWCGPCRTLGPILERVVTSQGARVVLGKLDVDKAKEIATQEGVKSIPDVRMFVNGKRVDQFVGALPEEEVRNRISRQVAALPKPANAAQAAPSSPVKQPVAPIGPMDKNWLPPGIERRDKNDKK